MTRPANGGIGEQKQIIIGRIGGIYGVSGWLRIISYTRPRQNIFLYTPWLINQGDSWVSRELVEGKKHGKGLIAMLNGLNDRDDARLLIGRDISVYRNQMPELPHGEYYWCDLIEMEVVNQNNEILGIVSEIQETGANDVLLVVGQHRYMIPLIFGRYVLNVDMERSQIMVDWDLHH